MALSNHLKQLMQQHGNLTVSDLARLTNIPQPTLHHLLTGHTSRPRKKLVQALAQFFSMSPEELSDVEHSNHTLPILDWDELPSLNNLDFSCESRKKVLTEINLNSKAFALQCNSMSMEPLFPEGCILIFDPTKIPQDRNLALIYFEAENKYLLKRIFIKDSLLYVAQITSNNISGWYQLNEKDTILAILVESKIQY